jgi:glycosyltransferase involved in cell wall biosynthesis
MEASRRRVLVLAYFFPPLGGGGVQRTLKFVRHLEPLGWDTTVITTRSRVYGARDPSLASEIPSGTHVVRTPAFPLGRWLGILLHHLRLRRLRAWVTWPDGGLGWAPFALVAALRAARRERPDVLYSSSAPYAGHLAALLVAHWTGIPWVADFRDEWAANPHLADQPRRLAALATRAERAITTHARRIVVAGDYFRLAGLDNDDPRRVHIPNGVDEDDVPSSGTPGPPADRFVLAHVGTIYNILDPSRVLRVLAALARDGLIDGTRLEVRLVGGVWLPGFTPPPGIRVEASGYVEHARAVAEMRAATALLLFVPRTSLAPSGKLFEYLASGRPLLCLTHPDNLAARLVRDWEAGVTGDPDDDASIEQAVLALWNRWREEGLRDQAQVRARTLERYSRRGAARRLAQVLGEVGDG